MPPILTALTWARILAHCQKDWPKESCGFVLDGKEAYRPYFDTESSATGIAVNPDGGQLVYPAENIADECHARNPARFPRPAEECYIMAPGALARVELLRRRATRILAIYHSHTRREGAKLSADDIAGATILDGHPSHPDAIQVVVSIDGRGPTEANGYRWDPDRREYVCVAAAVFSRVSGEVLRQDPGRELIEA